MRILVVVGECLLENSSANLCHIKYIEGLIKAGHYVDLLTVSEEGLYIDGSMVIPPVNRVVKYKDSLYRRGRGQKQPSSGRSIITEGSGRIVSRKPLKAKIKAFIRGLYGVYGIESGWMLHALRFREKQPYDIMLSLAYPPVSHRTAEILILLKRIQVKKWIQIWEDPWYSDLNAGARTDRVKKEEGRVIAAADVVYYVSPLTMLYQQKLFPKSAGKMRWQPLPAYYEDKDDSIDFSELRYGYFGDYSSKIRNLRPFYQYAVENSLSFTICGNSNEPFVSESNTIIYPRVTLEKLRPIEAETNVLVFVCNLRGGQIPGKIYQYSATNKYIVFILDGTEEEQKVLYDYFSQFHRYVFCENTKESIAEAINIIKVGKLPESYRTALSCFAAEEIIKNIIQGK